MEFTLYPRKGPQTDSCIGALRHEMSIAWLDHAVSEVASELLDFEGDLRWFALKGAEAQKRKNVNDWRKRLKPLANGHPPNAETSCDDVVREMVRLFDWIIDSRKSAAVGWRDRALELQQRFRDKEQSAVGQSDIDDLKDLVHKLRATCSSDAGRLGDTSAEPNERPVIRRKRAVAALPPGWSREIVWHKVVGYRGPTGSGLRASSLKKAWELYRSTVELLQSSEESADDDDPVSIASDVASLNGLSDDVYTSHDDNVDAPTIVYIWSYLYHRHLPAMMSKARLMTGDRRSIDGYELKYCAAETSREELVPQSDLREIKPSEAARRDAGEPPSTDICYDFTSVLWPKRTWCRSKPSHQCGDSSEKSPPPLKSLELCAGTARLSKELRALGCKVAVNERYGERVEWDPHDLPEAETELFEVDMLRIDPTRLDVYDIIHASPECLTYSGLSQAKHQREESNGYRGVTAEAATANREFDKLVSILQNGLERNPNLKFTVENPWNAKGGMHTQEKVTAILERPQAEGGLGATRCFVTYCMFGADVMKPTVIWTNCSALIETLRNGQHYCGGACGLVCSHVRLGGKHPESIKGMGNQVKSAAFPRPFAWHMAGCLVKEASQFKRTTPVEDDDGMLVQPPKRRRLNHILTENDSDDEPAPHSLLEEMSASLASMVAAVQVVANSMEARASALDDDLSFEIESLD